MAYRGGPPPRFGMMPPGFRPPMPQMGGLPMPFAAQPQFFVQPPHVQQRPAAGASAGPTSYDNKPPVTTVFVGNITEKAEDELVKSLLQECGPVSTWKRIQGPNGILQAFGFCEFDHPDGTLRALRVLNQYQLGNKKLVVKVEDKTKALIREFLVKRREAKGLPVDQFGDDLPVDEETVKDDDVVKDRITKLIESSQPDLFVEEPDDGELPDKDDLENKDSSPSRKKDQSPSRRKRSRSRSVDGDGKRRRHRRSRSKDRKGGRDRDDSEDSDDARERRAVKKKLKEKEQAYLVRLKKWEARERRMAKHYEKDAIEESVKLKSRQTEMKKLKQFLEDYDDDRDDPKYFNMIAKGSSLYQRKRFYEREREQDAKDRQKELQEIEELKKEIVMENKNVENLDEEAQKRHKQREEEAMRKRRANSRSPNPHFALGQKPVKQENGEFQDTESPSSTNDLKLSDGVMKTGGWATVNSEGTPNQSMSPAPASFSKPSAAVAPVQQQLPAPSSSSTSVPSVSASVQKPNVSTRLNGVFGVDDDEDDQIIGMVRKKPLKPFEITKEDRMQAMTAEERKKMIRDLIDRIPTAKDDLFAYPIEWSFVDEDLIKSRVRPWVSKKILEYIGEEEVSLVDFVCDKIGGQTSPHKLLRDIAMVLDEEAEIFVVKMWRLLIYESESKRLGIPRSSSSS